MFSAVASVAYTFLPTKYFADVATIKKAAEDPVVDREDTGLKGVTKTIKLEKEWLESDEVPQLECVYLLFGILIASFSFDRVQNRPSPRLLSSTWLRF